MAVTIADTGASVPTPNSYALNREVTITEIIWANFGLTVTAANNRVVLHATVGVASTLGTPKYFFPLSGVRQSSLQPEAVASS
ncbi:MAG: hypothetical protein K0Q73_6298 [Paenibacillus sp.]|jgi:hypothetical protein|nr:hypothetical protein [Paenibacillus sp.]